MDDHDISKRGRMVVGLGAILTLVLLPIVAWKAGAETRTADGLPIDKLDSATCDGLAGAYHSLCYRVHEIENHHHSNGRWFGLHGTPSGENTIMDSVSTEDTPFQIDAGVSTWGSWVQVVGATDTPIDGTNAYFDLHRIEVVNREHNTTVYVLQIGCDTSGANALTNGNYGETVYYSGTAVAAGGPIEIQMPRYAAGTKCWARVWAHGQSTSTFDFFIGIHEYAG